MALRPENRYSSPRELAEEIEHWLADEPVQAHREPLAARLTRAARKRPALTAGIGALLITGVIALAVSTLLIGQAQRSTTNALENLKEEQRQRALGQLNALRDANPGAVPGILADLEANRETVLPHLRDLFDGEQNPDKKMRLGLALLPVEPEKVRDDLVAWMLKAKDPADVLLVRDALAPHAGDLKAQLWGRVDTASSAERFRALVALAEFDASNPRWQKVASGLLEELLRANRLYFSTWVKGLRPARESSAAAAERGLSG